MRDFGNRHAGTLDGRLASSDGVRAEPVTITIAGTNARLSSVQHTAWMIGNLLIRLTPAVGRVYIDIQDDASLCPYVIPERAGGESFKEQFVEALTAFGLTDVALGSGGNNIYVGPGNENGLRAFGAGWTGGLSYDGVPTDAQRIDSTLPFGPYLAACLGAAEIFRMLRLRNYKPSKTVYYDSWSLAPQDRFKMTGPSHLSAIKLADITLAGVGAVANAWLHAIWATPIATVTCDIADPDPLGVEESNLNRYCLFGVTDIGKKKASAASERLTRPGLTLHPYDCRFEDLPHVRDVVVCAVDTEDGRANVQASYRPVMLMGSTLNLRAEVLRCTAPGSNACLRCYNEPPVVPTDEDLRHRMQQLSHPEFLRLTAAAGVTVQDAEDYVHRKKCGEASERLLGAVRRAESEQETRFAIGFVSVAAGVLLASETVKLGLADACGLNQNRNRAVLQFMNPANNLPASRLARNPKCPLCAVSRALTIWQERFRSHYANEPTAQILQKP